MAEELRGGVCGGSWPWSRNLFGPSPCSLASNPDHGLFVEANARSRDYSVGSGPDGEGRGRPADDWSHGLLPDDGNYSDILREDLNSGMDTRLDSFVVPAECLESCAAPRLSAGFPSNTASSLLQTLFDTDTDQLEQSSLLDSKAMKMMDYSANEFLPSFVGDPPMFGKQQVPYQDWSPTTTAAAAALSDLHGSLILPTQPRFLPSSDPNINRQHSLRKREASKDSSSTTKKSSNDQPIVKRPRIETPSPLPTFKVRKEKLGDRITALQQLVAPFGKTDTASVLHEAIEYIKFLHDQVSILCTPYLKKGSLDEFLEQHQKISSLRNGDLCLVPISSTLGVADMTADFWTPTSSFGGSFK